MTVLVVTEKPSVARDLAFALGLTHREKDAWIGEGWIVTWLVGHVAELATPDVLDSRWRKWGLEELPILPRSIPWLPTTAGRARIEVVRRLLRLGVERVVCATDAGREGELIFRVLAELVSIDLPVDRFWSSSMTTQEVIAAFEKLRPIEMYNGLADAALGRAWVDWWVGMNASRALTVTHGVPLTAGRVQTPTLALVTEQDQKIISYKAQPFWLAIAQLHCPTSGEIWEVVSEHRFSKADELVSLETSLLGAELEVQAYSQEDIDIPPPPFLSLEDLQQKACEQHDFTARKTLDVAQRLYEKHKIISYPRTSSRALTESAASILNAFVDSARQRYEVSHELTEPRFLGPPYIEDERVADHPAIHPLGDLSNRSLDKDETALFELIGRHTLAVLSPPARVRVESVQLKTVGELGEVYSAKHAQVIQKGWQTLSPAPLAESEGLSLPESLAEGMVFPIHSIRFEEQCEPSPKYLRDADLIKAMEQLGLGTPATRADIIEALIFRGYLERDKIAIRSTEFGRQLIRAVPEVLKTPHLTTKIECELDAILRGEQGLSVFVENAHDEVRGLVGAIVRCSPIFDRELDREEGVRSEPFVELPLTPLSSDEEFLILLQEGVDAKTEESMREALIAEKHCVVRVASPWTQTRYALLAARLGAAIVVRKDPALIDDEVMQLRSLGLRAESLHQRQIHDQIESVVRNWREAKVDVLFVTQECTQLILPVLSHRCPTVVVFDGEEFIPELCVLDSTPLEIMTAYSTQRLRELEGVGDIVIDDAPLGDALAVEVVTYPFRQKTSAIKAAIQRAEGQVLVRCQTPQSCETIAQWLRVECLHSGRSVEDRARIQAGFVEGRLPVLVATRMFSSRLEVPGLRMLIFESVAPDWGQFIDQLLGPSVLEDEVRVIILVESEEVSRGVEQFEREWPPPEALQLVLKELELFPQSAEDIQLRVGLERLLVERYLRLLVDYGAVTKESENGGFRVRNSGTLLRYEMRRRAQLNDLKLLYEWLDWPACRKQKLAQLLKKPSVEPCARCDACDGEGAVLRRYRSPDARDLVLLREILNMLARGGCFTSYQLLDALRSSGISSLKSLENMLRSLAAVGLVNQKVEWQRQDDEFDRKRLVWSLGRRLTSYNDLRFVRLETSSLS